MKSQPVTNVSFAKALADETRQEIMAICCCVKVSVNEIAERLAVSQPTVSHHLKILKDANLVSAERQGKQVFYTVNQVRMAQACCQLSQDFAPDLPISIDDPETI